MTEEKLKTQIAKDAKNGAQARADDEVKEDANAELEKGTKEYVAANRQKMLEHLNLALNETMILLDFTSLLSSKYSKAAESTMSEDLKSRIPPGTLSVDAWENMPEDTAQKSIDEIRCLTGVRMKSLTESADSLLEAATRLETDVKRETRYWQQVLGVQRKGWTIFRESKASRHFGVQVASIEAGPVFKSQGMITFEPDADGDVSLKHRAASEPKMVRVRLEVEGKVIGSSRMPVLSSNDNEIEALQNQVLRARDSLFEEELYHGMVIETRNMLSLGCMVRGNTIQVPILNSPSKDGQTNILIDLYPLSEHTRQKEIDNTWDELSQSISLALRLLLSHAHQTRLLRRTSRPPPTVDLKRQIPSPSILLPLIKTLRQQSFVIKIQSFVDGVRELLQFAGLSISSKLTKPDAAEVSGTNVGGNANIVDTANKQTTSILEMTLPFPNDMDTDTTSISIGIQTNLAQPPFTTTFSITLSTSLVRALYPSSNEQTKRIDVPDIDMIYSMISEVVALNIVDGLAQNDDLRNLGHWTTVPRQAELVLKDEMSDDLESSIAVSIEVTGMEPKLTLICESDKASVDYEWDAAGNSAGNLVDRSLNFAKL